MIDLSQQKNTTETKYDGKIINNDIEMSLVEHIEELRQRLIKSCLFFTTITSICLINIKELSLLLQKPAIGAKFLQLAPGEYFFSSIKISLYTGFIISSPFIIYQIILFILPGLKIKEAKFLVPILTASILLFFVGIYFSYKVLAPAALVFFIKYGSEIVEPMWSFERYFDFLLLLFFSTGLAFQIPIIQIVCGILNIISSDEMYAHWKYIVIISTIIGAILTPSTDPVTQILLALAILALYFSSILVLMLLGK